MVRDLTELGINLQKIVTRLQSNQNLLKLLYYNDKDPLSKKDLTQGQIKEKVFEKLIKIVPRVGSAETANSIISMQIQSGMKDLTNDEYNTITLQFEVFVPLTQWIIKDTNLRPFCIMSEIKKSLDNKVINGIGRLRGGDFVLNFLSDEMSCYEMTFYFVEYE